MHEAGATGALRSGASRLLASLSVLLVCLPACSDGGSTTPIDPDEVRAAYRKGLHYVRQRQPEQAAAELRRAVRMAPDHGEAWLLLGKVLVHLSDVVMGTRTRDREVLEQAVDALRKAAELKPENAEYAYWAGQALSFGEEKEEAIAYLRKALELDSKHGPAYKQLALIHTEMGDAERAGMNLRKAIEFLPDDASLWFRYGAHLEADEDLQGARGAYERAIEIDWTMSGPHTKLAVVLQRLGDPEGAAAAASDSLEWGAYRRELQAALLRAKANTGDKQAQLDVGELYFSAERYDSAVPWFSRALTIDPDDVSAKEALQRAMDGEQR